MSKYLAKENKMIKEVYHFALTRNYIFLFRNKSYKMGYANTNFSKA